MLIKDNLTRQKVVFCILLLLIAFFISSCGPDPVSTPIPGPAECKKINPGAITDIPSEGWQSTSCTGDMKTADTYCVPIDPDDPSKGQDCDYYCVPKTCGDAPYQGYPCEGAEVCTSNWVSPPDGHDSCCEDECALPCGYEIATGPQLTPRENYSIVYDTIQEIESSGDSVCEKQEEFC